MRFCPECGYEINGKDKCNTCGYNNKTKKFDKKINDEFNNKNKIYKEQSNDNFSDDMIKNMIINAKKMGISNNVNDKDIEKSLKDVHFNIDGCFTEEYKLKEMIKDQKENI